MTLKKRQKPPAIVNKKASYAYVLLHKYTAGIVLHGPEVKSISMNNANLQGAHCYFHNNELWLSGMHIHPYPPATHYNKPPTRPRKLLLKKSELRKLQKQKAEKSLTVIPLRVFLNDKHLIKVDIALAQGKKKHDKRATIKERDIDRRMRKKIIHHS